VCPGSNQSLFILLGLTDIKELEVTLFTLFFLFFLGNLTGNIFILGFTISNPSLHTPMYFFLGNLSVLDICFSVVVVPKMLSDFLIPVKSISFGGCIAQMHFFHFFGSSEATLLTIMSYDRYLAIGKPLHYSNIMTTSVCRLLVLSCWAIGFLHSLLHTVLTARMSYCKSHVVNHFFCDLTSLLSLSCSDMSTIELITSVEGYLFGFIPLFLTLGSYTYIIFNIVKIRSIDGRRKAFSTCSSHLTVIILFYGTIIFMYMRPASDYSPAQDKLLAMFYTNVIPVLNPLIYSLRNREVKSSTANQL
uniref:Olfactory receptor n=1 Tax=Leptobrachium leishanense TaxID=445787 RepID=A0A8C5QCF9_9ANUR